MTEENAIIRKLDAQLTARRALDDERVAKITRLREACEATKSWLATFVDDTWDGITREEAVERAEEVIQEARAALEMAAK